jgi:hypothetical protein
VIAAGRKAKMQMPLSNVCYSSTKQHQTTPAAPKNQKTQYSLGIKTFLSLSLVLYK